MKLVKIGYRSRTNVLLLLSWLRSSQRFLRELDWVWQELFLKVPSVFGLSVFVKLKD